MSSTGELPQVVKKPKTIWAVSETDFRDHLESCDGICLACGEWSWGDCEPDARGYPCESCDLPKVYGAEEALMMGRLKFI